MPKKQSFGVCQSPGEVEESTVVSVDRKLIRSVSLCLQDWVSNCFTPEHVTYRPTYFSLLLILTSLI